MTDGVHTAHRSDYNFDDAANEIRDAVIEFARMDRTAVEQTRRNAALLAEKALWKHFIAYYRQAYDVALRKAKARK